MSSKYVISAVDLKAVLDKIEAEGIVTVDAYPINQYLTEALSFSDVAALATERGLSDSATIQELASILFGSTAADSVTVSESAVIESGPGVID